MSTHSMVAGYGCCAICGFILDNQVAVITSIVIFVVIHVSALVIMIGNCYRRDKALKLAVQRRNNRANTPPPVT